LTITFVTPAVAATPVFEPTTTASVTYLIADAVARRGGSPERWAVVDAIRHHGSVDVPEWEYRRLYLPRGTSRRAAQQLLAAHAEYDHWELDRLRLYPDGSRRVVLRRRIIRQRRSA
jgi:hypothetical protein